MIKKLKSKLLYCLFGGVTLAYALPLSAGGYTLPVIDAAPLEAPAAASTPFNWSGGYAGGEIVRNAWDAYRKVTINRPELKDPIIAEEKIWRPTAPEDMFPGCHFGNNTCPVPVPGTGKWTDDGWTGRWQTAQTIVGYEVVREAYTETLEQAIEYAGNGYGLFAGYRHQFTNNVVTGVETRYGKSDYLDTVSLEGQLGYAFGRALPYVAAGVVNADGSDGWQAAVGVDYAVTDKLFVGVRYTKQDFDEVNGWKVESDAMSFRVGIRF